VTEVDLVYLASLAERAKLVNQEDQAYLVKTELRYYSYGFSNCNCINYIDCEIKNK